MEQSCIETLTSIVGDDDSVGTAACGWLVWRSAASDGRCQSGDVEFQLVILDEPTAALGVAQTRQVLDLVKRLAEKGWRWSLFRIICMIFLKWPIALPFCGSGRKVNDFAAAETTQQEVVHAITAGTMDTVPGMAEG